MVIFVNNIIEIKNLSFRYGNINVLDDINMQIRRGEFVGLIGPNGSGKSTLLKIILGLLTPQQGEVTLFGQSVNRFTDWDKIGYVSQKANSFNTGFPATVHEVVAMGLYGKKGVFKPLNRLDKERIRKAIELVGLSEFEKRNIGKLSGGQQQRTFIARALVNDPELLILDEPTVGIDSESTKQFNNLLNNLNKELGITIILVSHDIGVVIKQVTQVACLNKKLHFHGSPEEFDQNQNVLQKIYGVDMGLVNHHHMEEQK